MHIRVAVVAALVLLLGIGPASAQTLTTQDTTPISLKPTPKCPQTEVDRLQRVITFVRSQSWAEHPGSTAFLLNPDTTACRVVLKIGKVSNQERAALERGGEGLLVIEKTKDNAKPSRLPLLLWVLFGGAGVAFVFVRYGRR
ncbi:MAG TPA: hypothetical protein VGR20_16210 [Acidimicrobiia bacterium]|nr:hypothetical protein [Acidimicrobiia bacterium]